MDTSTKPDKCFQCGKPRIQTKQYTEYFNGSAVVTTESICSDPACQQRSMDSIEKERLKRNFSSNFQRPNNRNKKKKKANN